MLVNNLVVPVVLWGKWAPTHSISCIFLSKDQKSLVTGSYDGQVCVWNLNAETFKITPKCLMLGHTSEVRCIASASNVQDNLIVTSTKSGELCLWDLVDGKCREVNKLEYVHKSIQAYQMFNTEDVRLFCNGEYPEILVLDPISLEIIFCLTPKVNPDWINAIYVLRPSKRKDDVVLGLTITGSIKVWTLVGDETMNSEPIHENESKQIRCMRSLCMKCCEYNPRILLIICAKYWQIYDASNFSIICSVIAQRSERWVGGSFLAEDRVIVWSNRGKGYLYKLPTCVIPGSDDFRNNKMEADNPFVYCILSEFEDKLLSCPPAMQFVEIQKQNHVHRYFLRGDSSGKLIIWTIPEVSDSQLDQIKEDAIIKPAFSKYSAITSLEDIWNNLSPSPVGILDHLDPVGTDKLPKLTASIYLEELGRLVIGRQNGLINIINASQALVFQLLSANGYGDKSLPKMHTLRGHKGWINCFLYPYSVNKRYEKSHLVSGSVDFSVCLWDLNIGVLLHKFTIHAGEVLELLVPPDNCTARILKCICSVASDHSVSLINLADRKCVFLASRHLYPITKIKWRPFEDFMLVSCTDGSLSIWQMETGHLDRVLHGLAAEEILNTCEEVVNNQIILEMGLANPAVHLFRGLKHRNFSAIKHATQRGLQQLQQMNANQQQDTVLQQRDETPALLVQGLKANTCDSEIHVFSFDIESIIVELLTEEYSAMSPNDLEAAGLITETEYRKIETLTKSSSPDAQKKFTDFLGKVKTKAEYMEKKYKDKDKHGFITKMKEGVEQFQAKAESIMKHGQEDEKDDDGTEEIKKGLSLMDLEPSRAMEISQIVMSLLHSWGVDEELDKLCELHLGLVRPKVPISFGIVSRAGYMSLFLPTWSTANLSDTEPDLMKSLNMESDQTSDQMNMSNKISTLFSSRIHWELSTALTTNHLLTMIALSNTLRSISNATFIPEHERNRNRKLHRLHSKPEEIDEAYNQEDVQIKQTWSILSTLHCVLLPDKVQAIGSNAFKRPQVEILARRWQHQCIEIREANQSLLIAELNKLGAKGRKQLVEAWSQYLPSYTHKEVVNQMHASPSAASFTSIGSRMSSPRDNSEYEYEEEEEEQIRKPCSIAELKRKQTTAVVLLGIIGAKFGDEFGSGLDYSINEEQRHQSLTSDSVGVGNNLVRLTAMSLSHLLLLPNSPKLPLYTPLRRAAIDLIGRGFNIWEPYLDVSKVLLGLLELCSDYNKLVPTMNYGLPLTFQADSCRTAKNTLNLIATARPAAFVTTMAREVARYNSIQQNSQSSNINTSNSVLVKAKPEILHVVEMLIDRLQNDVVHLLVETLEVILHCIESNYLKSKSLFDVFPAISKFSQISHCCSTRRIAVGSTNGNLVIHDLKQNKSQSIRAHSNAINATSFSPDGKILATFSCGENRLGFWQTSSGIFGIGASQTRCIKTNNTTPVQDAAKYQPHKIGKLQWVSNKTVVLSLCNQQEARFNI